MSILSAMPALSVFFFCAFRHGDLWKAYAVNQYNVSPNTAGRVLAGVDDSLLERYNSTLSHQWRVYEHAIKLYQQR